jgi:hypothetical protein
MHGNSTFAPDVADEILRRLSNGETLRAICRDEHMPPESTVRGWAVDDQGGFAAQYARAREIGYHAMADEILEVSDDGQNDWMERNADGNEGWEANGEHLQRSRLRVDTRKWLLSKALPKIYGDKVSHEHGGPDGGAIPMAVNLNIHGVPSADK